jgi:hypothetical protein
MAYSNEKGTGQNRIATILEVVAWFTYIGGFIAGLSLARIEVPYLLSLTRTEFSLSLALTYWAGFFVTGTVFLGFSEIIKLLQKLVDKDTRIKLPTIKDEEKSREELFNDLPEL